METLLSKEYAVEDDEFLLKHQKFSKDATDDFVSKRNRPSDYEEDEFKQTLIKVRCVALQQANQLIWTP